MDQSRHSDFQSLTREFMEHEEFLKLAGINHHGNSILDHTIKVSYLAWKAGILPGLDRKSMVRGAMLHDFFLYDWKKKSPERKRKFYEIFKMHGFTHPAEALKNAKLYFDLNDIEENIIKRHMFPLTPVPPLYAESWLVTLCDKWVSLSEIPLYIKHLIHKN